jgi:hypothetical protein
MKRWLEAVALDERRFCSIGGGGSGGGGTNTQTVQKADPWEGQRPYLKEVYEAAKTASGATPTTAYSGPILAAPTSDQRLAVGRQGDLGRQFLNSNLGNASLQNALDSASGKFLAPSSNPTLLPAINAAVQPTLDRAQRYTLPQIGSDAWKSGAYGGTKHASHLANAMTEAVTRPAAEVAGKIGYDNYTRERGIQLQAPQQISAALNAELAPANLLQQSGQQTQLWNQQDIDAAMQRYQMDVEAPWQAIRPYAAIVQGFNPGGVVTGSSTGTMNAPRPSPMSGALGGAVAGGLGAYGLGSMVP